MALAILLGAPAASAKTTTIGSPMTTSFIPTAFGPEVTVAHAGLPEDGANVTAPVNGTIVSWKVLGAVGGPLTLRVIHPTSDTFFIGTGTTTSGPITGTGLLTFNANLQIKAGTTNSATLTGDALANRLTGNDGDNTPVSYTHLTLPTILRV